METRIHQFAGPHEAASAFRELNERVRHRMTTFMKNVVSRMVQLGHDSAWPGQLVLLTAHAMGQIPVLGDLTRVLAHVHEVMRSMLTGSIAGLGQGARMLRDQGVVSAAHSCIASLLQEGDKATRSMLTVGLRNGEIDLILADELALLRTDQRLELVLKGQGGFRID